MSNSTILRFLKNWLGTLYDWYKNSIALRIFSCVGRGIASCAKYSGVCRSTVKIGKAISLEEAQKRSGILQFLNRIVCRFFDFLGNLYQRLAKSNQSSLNHAVFCQVLAPLDGIFNTVYAFVMIGCGFLTVVVLKNVILQHFNVKLLVYVVVLFVLFSCAAMGDKLRQAANHSFFVRFIGIFFD